MGLTGYKHVSITDIVHKYRMIAGDGEVLSYRAFADQLNNYLKPNPTITHAEAHNWERGHYLPNYYMLIFLADRSYRTEWAGKMAKEILQRMEPAIWTTNH